MSFLFTDIRTRWARSFLAESMTLGSGITVSGFGLVESKRELAPLPAQFDRFRMDECFGIEGKLIKKL